MAIGNIVVVVVVEGEWGLASFVGTMNFGFTHRSPCVRPAFVLRLLTVQVEWE